MLLKGVLLAPYAAPQLTSVKASILPSIECQSEQVYIEAWQVAQKNTEA